MKVKIKKGDILEFDKNEVFETVEEFAGSIAWYNDISTTKELMDWCAKILDDSFKVEEVRYNVMFPEGTEKNIDLKDKVFYDEKFTELNIPTPFPNLWLTIPIECMKKVDVS